MSPAITNFITDIRIIKGKTARPTKLDINSTFSFSNLPSAIVYGLEGRIVMGSGGDREPEQQPRPVTSKASSTTLRCISLDTVVKVWLHTTKRTLAAYGKIGDVTVSNAPTSKLSTLIHHVGERKRSTCSERVFNALRRWRRLLNFHLGVLLNRV